MPDDIQEEIAEETAEKQSTEESFADLFEAYDNKLSERVRVGDKIRGEIISIGRDSVFVDTGTRIDGVVEKGELLDEEGGLPYKVGDVLELYAISVKAGEIRLSKAVTGAGGFELLQDAHEEAIPVEGKVNALNKGGFEVLLGQKRAFCPISQMDIHYVEKPEDYVGETFEFLITDFEEDGRNIVVSRRKLLDKVVAKARKSFFKDLAVGDEIKGKVTKLMPFGAFIEVAPGVEGMAHISELSWSRVEKADEIVQAGDMVTVKLLKIETREGDTPKISLSIKQVDANPWDSMGSAFKPGDQVMGKVVRLAAFGAFVELAPGVDGLVHISEMSHTKRVLRPEDVVQQGEQVQVVIKTIDQDSKRISLSIKDGLGDPWTGITTKYIPGAVVDVTLEKKETFGFFMNLEPGITGLMPISNIRNAASSAEYERLKPGDSIPVLIQEVDEDNRRLTLGSPEQKESDNWKQFAPDSKKETMGTMESLFREAMNKKK